MAKGRYAERARTKRDADAATAAAVVEINRLQARIRELEHAESERDVLRGRIEKLRSDIAALTSDTVRKLEAERDDLTHKLLIAENEYIETRQVYHDRVLEVERMLTNGLPSDRETVALLSATMGTLMGWPKEDWPKWASDYQADMSERGVVTNESRIGRRALVKAEKKVERKSRKLLRDMATATAEVSKATTDGWSET